MNSYKEDWRHCARHWCNGFAVMAYIFFEHGQVLPAAVCTLVAEILLAPSAMKHRSWSTLMSSTLFLGLSISTIARTVLFT